MGDKQSGKSTRRGQLSGQTEHRGAWYIGLFEQLSWTRVGIGLVFALVITFLLLGYQFGSLPNYKIGDIADRTVEAFEDFTVVDAEATDARRQASLLAVPAVFDFDPQRASRVEKGIRDSFEQGRTLLAVYRDGVGLAEEEALPPEALEEVVTEFENVLEGFDQEPLLEILVKHGFSPDLEDQMVTLVTEAMKEPGVIDSRELLLNNRDRGLVLRNAVTGKEDAMADWTVIRDLDQAVELLRQNQYRLTAVSGEEKRQVIEFLDKRVLPNIHFNDAETRIREEMAMEYVGPVLIQIKKGRILVRDGDEITAQDVRILDELRELRQATQPLDRSAGIFLLVAFFLYSLWRYLLIYQDRNRKPGGDFLLLGLVLLVNLVLAKLILLLSQVLAGSLTVERLQDPTHYYLIMPAAAGAILIVLLADARLCVLFSLTFSVLLGLMTEQLSMTVYAIVGSLTAIYMLRQYRERSTIIQAGAVVGIANVIAALAFQLYSSGFGWDTFVVRSLAAFVGGLFASMLAASLLPVLESFFDITTDIRLLELSNLNSPILRRLAVEAPGSYHHSIIVGTLSEAAAEAIGANSLLARVGAYYHDIGKLRKPEYYVENQIYVANKHESLSPSMSSLILASHVKDGLVLAQEIGLAPRVAEMIPQHHGTKLMSYFYQKAKQSAEGKEREVNEQDFRYPGPKPQSREAAILMLADQVEAASRTLQDPNPRQIRALIRRLIQTTIQDRQFDECDITTRDLNEITRAFERVITGMYHHRIEYPGFDFNRQVEEEKPASQHIQ